MDIIKAFVGHSFTEDDTHLIETFLKQLTAINKLHPPFTWEHAESPQLKEVDEKVLSLFEDKNLFIGICSKKERVIAQEKLSNPWWSKKSLIGNADNFEWKTSDWIIQEIGVAVGKGMKIILLIENGVRVPGALQGNLEYIPFDRKSPEQCFDRLSDMILTLSPQTLGVKISSVELKSKDGSPVEKAPLNEDENWSAPTADWKIEDYKEAILHLCVGEKVDQESEMYEKFLKSPYAKENENLKEFEAYREYMHILFLNNGDVSKLEDILKEMPDNNKIRNYLAESYLYYEEYSMAADLFLESANTEKEEQESITKYGLAAINYEKSGRADDAFSCLEKARKILNETGIGEFNFLEQ